MKVLANFQLIPLGVGVSVSDYIAECERILSASGLMFELHANGTNIEGEWDAVCSVVKACHERIHAMGAPRIQTHLSLGTRTDKPQSLRDKVESVNHRLARPRDEGDS